MKKYKYKERLGLVRLFLTLASCSPLLILWAMRGTDFLSDYNMWSLCLLFIFITNGYLYHRIQVAKKNEDIERITIKNANEHTDSLLVYLVAMLLPLYAIDLSNFRELMAGISAFLFIVFLFFHLNMHYMNIILALFGYRLFTVAVPISGMGIIKNVLITKRTALPEDETVECLRLSNTVYIEIDKE